ncbi:MAG: ABC transporter substrate-binding protein [Protaetiibacter sp.]
MSVDFIVASPDDAVEFNDAYRNITGNAGYIACNNIYSRLVVKQWVDPHAYPDLATHWECLDGGRRWRFHLNRAARWQDGHPLTAEDVAYTHTEVLKNGYAGARLLREVERVEVVNRHCVDYHLDGPNGDFLVMMGNFVWTHILPQHLYAGTDWATNPHNHAPVGSGPFRLVDWVPGEQVVMEAWRDYWGPAPSVDRLIIRIEPDRDECVRMVASGRAHYIPQDTLTLDRVPLLDDATVEIEKVFGEGPGMAYLDFNHRLPIWQNPQVRRAVAHAINRAEIGELADPGVSQAWDHYLLPNRPWAFDDTVAAPPFDLAESERLLDDGGLPRDASGGRGRLRLYYMDTFDGHRPIAEVVARQLGALGFDVEWEGLKSIVWADVISRTHEFDLIVGAGSTAPQLMSTKFTSTGARNDAGHRNAELDAAYRAAREAPTESERGALYREVQRITERDTEWIPLFWYGTYFVRSAAFFGWCDQLGGSIPWWHFGRMRPVDAAHG